MLENKGGKDKNSKKDSTPTVNIKEQNAENENGMSTSSSKTGNACARTQGRSTVPSMFEIPGFKDQIAPI